MKAESKRIVALTGGALMVAGMTMGTAGAASADERRGGWDNDRRATTCTVDLDQWRGDLEIDLRSNSRGDTGYVTIDFSRGRDGDDSGSVELVHGDVSGDVQIPRRARSVEVVFYVESNRGPGLVSCKATLNLRQRDHRGSWGGGWGHRSGHDRNWND